MGSRSYLLAFFSLVGVFALPGLASAADIGFVGERVTFSKETYVAGDSVRIYAHLKNFGAVDTVGQVGFFRNEQIIGKPQDVSLTADGFDEQVYVDFVIPNEPFNVSVRILGTVPEDTNTANDTYLSPIVEPKADSDRDGVIDEDDNCPYNANEEQDDFDGDSTGDQCDVDDDNDTLKDDVEEELGTDPRNPDTDNDGINDADDPTPTGGEEPVEVQTVDVDTQEDTEDSSAPVVERSEPQQRAPEQREEPENREDGGFLARFFDDNTTVDATDVPNRRKGTPAPSGAQVLTSDNKLFVAEHRSWNRYRFMLSDEDADVSSVVWSFGDGEEDMNPSVEHVYTSAGTYTVRAQVTHSDGSVEEDVMEISLSFFHLANPVFMAFVVVLIVMTLLTIATLFRLGESEEDLEEDED